MKPEFDPDEGPPIWIWAPPPGSAILPLIATPMGFWVRHQTEDPPWGMCEEPDCLMPVVPMDDDEEWTACAWHLMTEPSPK